MTKEQAKLYAQKTFTDDKQTKLDKLYNFWEDPREKFNDVQINNEKKSKYLNYLLTILAGMILMCMIQLLYRIELLTI